MADGLHAARQLFSPDPGVIYLDAATYGLPPRPTVEALDRGIRRWQAGTGDWIEEWDRPSDSCRADFATLIGSSTSEIAALPAASVAVGMVAESLRPGDEVVVPEQEFASVLYPLLVAARRGVIVREVPLHLLAEALTPATRLVAFSHVQMQSGRVADVAAVCEAASRHGTWVFLDATQSLPFIDLRPLIDRLDFVVCAAYKHLLCPRGVTLLHVRPERWDDVQPTLANWRAADEPYSRYFGGPLRLAPDAARFDISRAWLPWLGAIESLRLLVAWREAGLFDDVLALARSLAEQVGVPWPGATLVSVPVTDPGAAQAALREAGIRASVRGSAIRLSPHVYNTTADIDRAAEVIGPFVAPSAS